MATKFLKQYLYNTKLDVTLKDLETTKQRANESFFEFLTRWRGKATKMINRPSKKDQVYMIINNLQAVYHKKLFASLILTFE